MNRRRSPPAPDRYWLTRFALLRLLGVVYAVAFPAAALQLVPLIASDGLLPVSPYLDSIARSLGSRWDGFWTLPSLFWIGDSDAALRCGGVDRAALSCAVVAAFANSLLLANDPFPDRPPCYVRALLYVIRSRRPATATAAGGRARSWDCGSHRCRPTTRG